MSEEGKEGVSWKAKTIIAIVVIVAAIIGYQLLKFHWKRTWNYNMSYRGKVEKQVEKQVDEKLEPYLRVMQEAHPELWDEHVK